MASPIVLMYVNERQPMSWMSYTSTSMSFSISGVALRVLPYRE